MKNKAHAFASIPIIIGTKAAQANATTKALSKSMLLPTHREKQKIFPFKKIKLCKRTARQTKTI